MNSHKILRDSRDSQDFMIIYVSKSKSLYKYIYI